MIIADFGFWTCFFPYHGQIAGETGVVYAVDSNQLC
jgi:hypothetical protein